MSTIASQNTRISDHENETLQSINSFRRFCVCAYLPFRIHLMFYSFASGFLKQGACLVEYLYYKIGTPNEQPTTLF